MLVGVYCILAVFYFVVMVVYCLFCFVGCRLFLCVECLRVLWVLFVFMLAGFGIYLIHFG